MTVFTARVADRIAEHIKRRGAETVSLMGRIGCSVSVDTFLAALLPAGARAHLEFAFTYHNAGQTTPELHTGEFHDEARNKVGYRLRHPIILRHSWKAQMAGLCSFLEGTPEARRECADAYEQLFATSAMWSDAVCAFRLMNHALSDGGALNHYLPWLCGVINPLDKPNFEDVYGIEAVLGRIKSSHLQFRSRKYNEACWDALVNQVTPKSYVGLARPQVEYLARGKEALAQAEMLEASAVTEEAPRDDRCYFTSVEADTGTLGWNNPFADDDRFTGRVHYV